MARGPLATNKAVTALCEQLAHKGIVEQPAGSNNQWFGRRYIFNRVAWCAISQSVVLMLLNSVSLIGGKTALAKDFMDRAKRGVNGMKWITHSEHARVGDYPVWAWDRRNAMHVSRIRTISGHEGTTHGGNENSRWGVQHRNFKTVAEGGYVLGFARPAYGTKPRHMVKRVVGGLVLALAVGTVVQAPAPKPKPVPVVQPAKPPVAKPKPKPVAAKPVVRLNNVRFKKTNGDVLDTKRALYKKGYRGFTLRNSTYGSGTVKAMAKYQKRAKHKVNGKKPNAASLRGLGLRVR